MIVFQSSKIKIQDSFRCSKCYVAHVNAMPGMTIGKVWEIMIKFIAPLILIILLTTEFVARIKAPYEGYPREAELIGAAVMFIIIPVAAIIFSRLNGAGAVEIERLKTPD